MSWVTERTKVVRFKTRRRYVSAIDALTPEKVDSFLDMIGSLGVAESARRLGLSRSALYRQRKMSGEFAAQWATALGKELG
jgi:hypothetical protein